MSSSRGYSGSDVARCWAGFASLGAGLVHFAVVREHVAEWWVFGVFFVGLGAYQVGWAVLALARSRAPLFRVTVLVNLGAVLLWIVSRTLGIPVGPEPWTPEAVGTPDVLASVLEVGTLLALAASAAAARGVKVHRSAPAYLGLLAAGALAVSAATMPALAATDAGAHAQPHTHGAHH